MQFGIYVWMEAGFTNKEIAEHWEITEGLVRYFKKAIRAKLRKALDECGG